MWKQTVCMHHWVSDTLTGRTRVCNKAATEMLLRRWLNTLKKLVEEYDLTVDVVLVPSNKNMANQLTRVPQWLFTAIKMENGPMPLIDAIHVDELDADQIMAIHRSSGHPRARHTTYFVRRICPATPRAAIKMAIRTCEECESIDPAPVHWEKGTLEVDDNWQRLGMNITYYGAHHFLTLTDYAPFLNLEAIAKTRLCKRDSPAEDPKEFVWWATFEKHNSVFWMWPTTRTPYR